MAHFSEIKDKLDKRPVVQAAAARQKAVIATGRMVYEWRKAANFSQQALAQAIGTKQESISRIERGLGHDGPKLTTLAAIAEACGQRFIISGGAIDKVSLSDESDAESAWGVLPQRPVHPAVKQARAAGVTARSRYKLPVGGNVDVQFVTTGYRSKADEHRPAKEPAGLRVGYVKGEIAKQLKQRSDTGGYRHVTPVRRHGAGGELLHGARIVRVDTAAGHKPLVVMELKSGSRELQSLLAAKLTESGS
ncbi:MAG: helix-turn-helix transcriptional regulator [Pseudomonadota bacterium]